MDTSGNPPSASQAALAASGQAATAATNTAATAATNLTVPTVTNQAVLTAPNQTAPAGFGDPTPAFHIPRQEPRRPLPSGHDDNAVNQFMVKMGATEDYEFCLCCGQAQDFDHRQNFVHCPDQCWRCYDFHPHSICPTWNGKETMSWW